MKEGQACALLFIDIPFTQAGSVSAAGHACGSQPTLADVVNARIAVSRQPRSSVTSIKAIYVPADDYILTSTIWHQPSGSTTNLEHGCYN